MHIGVRRFRFRSHILQLLSDPCIVTMTKAGAKFELHEMVDSEFDAILQTASWGLLGELRACGSHLFLASQVDDARSVGTLKNFDNQGSKVDVTGYEVFQVKRHYAESLRKLDRRLCRGK